MKRIVFAFVGTASAGLVLYLVLNFVHPVENTRRFVNITWQCSAFMAIVAGLYDLKRRANKRLAQQRAEGPSQLPEQFPEVIRASAVPVPQSASGSQAPRAGEVPGLTSVTEPGERPVVFRPRGVAMLIVAMLLAAIGAFYIVGVGVLERGPASGTMNVPGLAATGVALVGAVLCFCLFISSRLPGKKITIDSSGIILPGHIRVTWDLMTEIRMRNVWGIESLATVRLRLKDGRRVRIARNQIGRMPRELFEAIQVCFEQYQKRAQRSQHVSEPRGSCLRPPAAAASPNWSGKTLSRSK